MRFHSSEAVWFVKQYVVMSSMLSNTSYLFFFLTENWKLNIAMITPTKTGLFWGSKNRWVRGGWELHHRPTTCHFFFFSPNQMKIGRNIHHHGKFHFLSEKNFDCPRFCLRQQKISKNMPKTMPYQIDCNVWLKKEFVYCFRHMQAK